MKKKKKHAPLQDSVRGHIREISVTITITFDRLHESCDSEKEIYQTGCCDGCCTFRVSLFMFQNNETAAIVVYQTNPVGVEPFSY